MKAKKKLDEMTEQERAAKAAIKRERNKLWRATGGVPTIEPRIAFEKEMEALRTSEWKAKYPNAVHPPCPWCEVPHEPVPMKTHGDGGPDGAYCEVHDARLDSEDYARLEKRLNEMLDWIGDHDFECQIGELFQGDQWRFFGKGKGCDDDQDTKDWERGPSMCELLRRLDRIRRDLVISRALAAQMSASWRRTAERMLVDVHAREAAEKAAPRPKQQRRAPAKP